MSIESPTRLSGKPRHIGNFGRRELSPEEIIRLVKERFRICNYLFRVGGCWIFGIFAIEVVPKLTGCSPGRDNLSDWILVLMMIGAAIFTCAMALTFALYRCPVCDKYLSRYRSDKFHCAGCGVQVKEPA
jgi:hypothetical protein